MPLLRSWRAPTPTGDLLVEESNRPLMMSVSIRREGSTQRVHLTKKQWDDICSLGNSYSQHALTFVHPVETEGEDKP